nr:putative reverse transcriptase domain-containing protein [Tanacetum cinerariifolium]
MVNVIPLDHVDEVPVVEPNQHDDVPVVPEPVLVGEDKDPEEDEFKEKEDPQEEEDDMEIHIKEDENELELTYLYEEVDPLNPSPPALESEHDDEIEVENLIKHEDETVPSRVHEVGESSAALSLRKDSDSLLPGLMRRDINSFGNEVCSSEKQGTAATEKLVEKLGNTEDGLSDSVDAAIAAERARQESVRNDVSGYGPVKAIKLQRWFEKTESVFEISECAEGKKVKFAAATLEGPTLTWWKTMVATMCLKTVNQMHWIGMKQMMIVEFCPIEEVQRMEHEFWNLKLSNKNRIDCYSNLRFQFGTEDDVVVSIDEIQLDDKLHMIEEPVEVMDREVKQHKQSRIPIVKVHWNYLRGPEFTWEREDQIKKKYPHLFT